MNLKFIAWEPVADNVYKVVVERQQGTEVPSREEFQKGVDEILGFGFKVKDNISEVVSANGRVYDRLVLSIEHETLDTDDETMEAFSKISAHVYRNKGDNSIYKVIRAEDGTEKLVREDTIDAEEILNKQEVENYDDDVANLLEPDVYAGDYVSYVNGDGNISEGWVANEDDDSAQYVIDFNGEEEEILSASQYLSVVPSTHPIIAAELGKELNESPADAMAAIKKWYGNVDFMREVKKALGDSKLISEEDAVVNSLVMPKTNASDETTQSDEEAIKAAEAKIQELKAAQTQAAQTCPECGKEECECEDDSEFDRTESGLTASQDIKAYDIDNVGSKSIGFTFSTSFTPDFDTGDSRAALMLDLGTSSVSTRFRKWYDNFEDVKKEEKKVTNAVKKDLYVAFKKIDDEVAKILKKNGFEPK